MGKRPIAKKVWSGSTSTGIGVGFFGTGFRVVSAYIGNASTKTFVNRVEVTVGNSTVWAEALTDSSSTGGTIVRTSTAGMVFDKARLNVSSNATTGSVSAWLAVSV